jgi:hypothetical protein
MTSLAARDNSFKEANHVYCFNYTLQLLGKTLKPFNASMLSGKGAQNESLPDDDKLPNLEDLNEEDENGGGDYDGEDKGNNKNNNINELEELDKTDRE